MGSVAEDLKYSNAMEWYARHGAPLGVVLRLVRKTLNMPSNVKIWRFPANGSRIYMPCARPVGLTLIGDRVRMW